MTPTDRLEKQRTAEELEEPVSEAAALARKLGLSPYPVNYWIVDYDEMNELIAYGGFQERYPHWRWGMAYDRQRKQGQFLGGKAFEIVNNDDPAHAFLQVSNSLADQKAVITHVEAHADFFANNEWFGLFADRGATGGSRVAAPPDADSGPGAESGPETEVGPDREADGSRVRTAGDRGPDAAAMLARHAETVREYLRDPEIDRAEVEQWIDNALCLEDNVDQHRPYVPIAGGDGDEPVEFDDLADQLDDLDVSAEVREHVFTEEWLEAQADDEDGISFPPDPEPDLLGFLRAHGKQYDEEAERATEMTDWQTDVLELLRREAYYFAPQKMTKVMNEGWAAYHESLMMTGEGFAGTDEFLTYADHMAKVLGSGGLNPYALGMELWEYVESRANRRHVVELLLRVDGITPANFHDAVDFDRVLERLAPDDVVASVDEDWLDAMDSADPRIDAAGLEAARAGEVDVSRYPWKVLTYEGLAERHYSLARPQYRGFLARVGGEELESIDRYLFDDAKYADVDEAVADVDYAVGWDRMREVRESHNDVTFLDEFLTQEFVDDNDYFTYEWLRSSEDHRVTSTDHEDVKRKLLLQFTNFGKPTIVVADGNFENRNELLLEHRYNGVQLDLEDAKNTLERVFELWGRPVVLRTIVKSYDERDVEVARRRDSEPEPEETGLQIRFDGMEFEETEVRWSEVDHLAADDVDYDTKPEEWLA